MRLIQQFDLVNGRLTTGEELEKWIRAGHISGHPRIQRLDLVQANIKVQLYLDDESPGRNIVTKVEIEFPYANANGMELIAPVLRESCYLVLAGNRVDDPQEPVIIGIDTLMLSPEYQQPISLLPIVHLQMEAERAKSGTSLVAPETSVTYHLECRTINKPFAGTFAALANIINSSGRGLE